MKNADRPAYPDLRKVNNKDGNGYVTEYCTGLTKREMIAAMAMQQLIGSVMCANNEAYQRQLEDWLEKFGNKTLIREALCKDAIEFADELLKQIETPNT